MYWHESVDLLPHGLWLTRYKPFIITTVFFFFARQTDTHNYVIINHQFWQLKLCQAISICPVKEQYQNHHIKWFIGLNCSPFFIAIFLFLINVSIYEYGILFPVKYKPLFIMKPKIYFYNHFYNPISKQFFINR